MAPNLFKSRLRRVVDNVACPYSDIEKDGTRQCTGYNEESYTCTEALDKSYCGIYKIFEGIKR